jgi:peptide/nickel transport system ATP-binding protein/oligopeptide transport system ATP-binding protein
MPSTIIKVQNLSRAFKGSGGSVLALDSISISLQEGKTLAVVGESGSGKTTAARLILGLDKPTAGSISVLGQEITDLGPSQMRPLRREIQVVQQDPFSQLNRRHTVRRIIEGPMLAFKVGDRKSREKRVIELIEAVGLQQEHLTRKPHELSGGQCQRVAIARALALDPKILILDEAVSALDVSVRAQVLNLLKKLQKERGLTYLFITHDLGVAHYMADEIVVMFRGRIVERGTREEVFQMPRHHYTAGLLASVPVANFSTDKIVQKISQDVIVQATPDKTDACAYRSRCQFGRDKKDCSERALTETMASATHGWICHFPIER